MKCITDAGLVRWNSRRSSRISTPSGRRRCRNGYTVFCIFSFFLDELVEDSDADLFPVEFDVNDPYPTDNIVLTVQRHKDTCDTISTSYEVRILFLLLIFN